jgi:hypothetical protein
VQASSEKVIARSQSFQPQTSTSHTPATAELRTLNVFQLERGCAFHAIRESCVWRTRLSIRNPMFTIAHRKGRRLRGIPVLILGLSVYLLNRRGKCDPRCARWRRRPNDHCDHLAPPAVSHCFPLTHMHIAPHLNRAWQCGACVCVCVCVHLRRAVVRHIDHFLFGMKQVVSVNEKKKWGQRRSKWS